MSERGISKFFREVDVIPDIHTKSHKRSKSDTAVSSKIEIKTPLKCKMSQIPETTEQHIKEGEDLLDSNKSKRNIWKFPPPASDDQSLYDYIQCGNFSKDQSPLDIDNAHILLAEAIIYVPHDSVKIKESRDNITVSLPSFFNKLGSPIREKSAEHTILSMLNLLEDPHFIKAKDTFKLLKERGESSRNDQEADDNLTTALWYPPQKELLFNYYPKPT